MYAPFGALGEHVNCEQTLEITLDPEVYRWFCRRGRRRLREIQTSSQAALKLDRYRSVLRLQGSWDAVADAQGQLESFWFAHKKVTNSVWQELMRTRTDTDINRAALARIQHETGCRIHIERDNQQVQLFGPNEVRADAQLLLQELESMCSQETVDMRFPLAAEMPHLQKFALEFGVTAIMEDATHVTVMGLSEAVVEMAEKLRNYASGEQLPDFSNLDGTKSSDVANLAINAAMSKLTVGSVKSNVGNQDSASCRKDRIIAEMPASFRKGLFQPETKKVRDKSEVRTFQVCPTCGSSGFSCAHCGKSIGKMLGCPQIGCPTCGVVNFCVFCGEPTKLPRSEKI